MDIDGLRCQIIQHTPNEIQCWTSPPSLDSNAIANSTQDYPHVLDGYRFKGTLNEKTTVLTLCRSYNV